MKKIFTLLTALFAVIAVNAQTWNFSEWENGNYEDTTKDGLTLTGKWTVDGNNKTVNEIAYTKRIKSGGARTMSFAVTKDCTIELIACSASSSEDRVFTVSAGETQLKECTAGSTPIAFTADYKGTGATINVATAGGINFYAIYIKDATPGGGDGQKYVWSVADVAGDVATLKSIIVNNPDASQASVFEATEGPVTIKGVSGPVAGFKDYDTPDEADKPTALEATYDNTWSGLKTQGDCEKGPFYYVQGKGNPVDLSKVEIEAVTAEGVFNGKYRANWEKSYYVIDGSNGLCSNGTYMTLTSTQAGKLTAQVWINKGSRAVYVVPASTKVALTPDKITVSGYVNGQNNAESKKLYFEPNTNLTYDAVETNGVTKYYVMHHQWDEAHTTDSGQKAGQATFVYLTWEATAGETYFIFNDNTQIGIGGFEFVSDGTTGISDIVVEKAQNDAIYNIAGQRVSGSAKGLVIKNGKKYFVK